MCAHVGFQNELENERITLGFPYAHFPTSSPSPFELCVTFFFLQEYGPTCMYVYLIISQHRSEKNCHLIYCHILSQFFDVNYSK